MVKDVLNSPDDKKNHIWARLIRKGDHANNSKSMESKRGEVIIGRRHDKQLNLSLYGPCPECLIWLRLDKTLYNHQAVCPIRLMRGDKGRYSKGEVRIRSFVVSGRITCQPSTMLLTEVYPIMTNDLISHLAQNDNTIVALGNSWIRRNISNELRRKYYASSRMRQAARLLINVRDVTKKEAEMRSFLVPQHFDSVVRGALLTASSDYDDDEDLNSPSTAVRLSYDIKRMVNAVWGEAIRANEDAVKKSCKDFLRLMSMEWGERVSKLATNTLQQRRHQRIKNLPLPSDLEKLQTHIKEELRLI